MNEEDVQFWSNVAKKIIEEAQMAISPLVGTTKGGEIVKMGADGTPTKLIDLVAENKVVEVLEDTGRSVTLISEEIGEFKIGEGSSEVVFVVLISEEIGEFKIGEGSSEVVFVVDPLDGTSNALKNIPAYAISVAIADASSIPKTHKTSKNLENISGHQNLNLETSNRPQDQLTIEDIEIGFVKNLATGDLYEAVKGQGARLNGKKLVPSTQEDISKSSIGAYIYRAEMDKVDKLCKAVRRMRILGSVAIELCYVADGTYDAFIDIRGNLRIVDMSAAKLIIEETRGIVTDEKCQPLNGKLNVLERTSIVAACNPIIHSDIIQILGGI
ncbi:MAG: inositol monophosphatase [Methanobacterium paludis]|nr:inositol monophosphatase [Methanobacterium paludis]